MQHALAFKRQPFSKCEVILSQDKVPWVILQSWLHSLYVCTLLAYLCLALWADAARIVRENEVTIFIQFIIASDSLTNSLRF